MKYRKKPVIVDAIEWTGANHGVMYDFLTGFEQRNGPIQTSGANFHIDHKRVNGGLVIKTLEGEHIASIGDYIIKGVKGEFYPCKPDVFKATYEPVVEHDIENDPLKPYVYNWLNDRLPEEYADAFTEDMKLRLTKIVRYWYDEITGI